MKNIGNLKDSYKVLKTTNYNLFKIMEKNREIDHWKKVVSSIQKVGYVPVPIVVNENMEIIDGQNRYEAAKFLNLPVYYMVISGLTIEHCRSLNIGQSNWKLKDYVKSYSIENISYTYLLNLMKQFPEFTPRVIAVAAGSFGATGGGHTNAIIEGRYHCTEEQYEKAIDILAWLRSVNEKVNKAPGKTEYLRLALIFAYKTVPDVNASRLTSQVNRYMLTRDSVMNGIVSMESAIRGVDDFYNYRNKKGFDIISAYRKAIKKGTDEPEAENSGVKTV